MLEGIDAEIVVVALLVLLLTVLYTLTVLVIVGETVEVMTVTKVKVEVEAEVEEFEVRNVEERVEVVLCVLLVVLAPNTMDRVKERTTTESNHIAQRQERLTTHRSTPLVRLRPSLEWEAINLL